MSTIQAIHKYPPRKRPSQPPDFSRIQDESQRAQLQDFLQMAEKITVRVIKMLEFDGLSFIERSLAVIDLLDQLETEQTAWWSDLLREKVLAVVTHKQYITLSWVETTPQLQAKALARLAENSELEPQLLNLINGTTTASDKLNLVKALGQIVCVLTTHEAHVIKLNIGQLLLQPFFKKDLTELCQALLRQLAQIEI